MPAKSSETLKRNCLISFLADYKSIEKKIIGWEGGRGYARTNIHTYVRWIVLLNFFAWEYLDDRLECTYYAYEKNPSIAILLS